MMMLPLPYEDIGPSLLGHVIGSFVAWQKFFVIFDDMMVIYLSFHFFIKKILLALAFILSGQ